MPASKELRWLVSGQGFVSLAVVAQPGSARPGILRRDSRGLLIALSSQPQSGRANQELIAFLAHLLRTPCSAVTIIRGHTSRQKTVRVANPQPELVEKLLRAYA
jgi:uncharacterized protein